MTKIRGAYTALITPMLSDGALDYAGWQKLLEDQLAGGINGLVPLGTTGETPTLSDDEDGLLTKQAVELCKGKVPVIAGASSNNTRDAVRYTERAAKYGADYVLVCTPYYNKPSDQGIFRHFEEVSKVGLPVIVYNIAGRTGRNIPTPLMEKIAALPNIAGVKEASGDINQMGDVLNTIAAPKAKAGGKFFVFSGDDALTLPLMALGGDGIISVISNLVPARVKALSDACLAGDYEKARAVHFELLPLVKAAFVETNPVPIKLACGWAGLPAGPCRPPLGKLDAKNEGVLREAVGKLGVRI
jgi:4-hydroxy-tetrahydrodipicolinate synthase